MPRRYNNRTAYVCGAVYMSLFYTVMYRDADVFRSLINDIK